MYYSVRSSPGQALAVIQESILRKKNSLGVMLTCKTQQACASLEFLQQLGKASREYVYRKLRNISSKGYLDPLSNKISSSNFISVGRILCGSA